MADEKKGTTVLAFRGSSLDEEFYEDGTNIQVSNDGHLHVYADGNYILAIYAPGKWQNAKVNR